MPDFDEDVAKFILNPYHDRIFRVFRRAFDEFRAVLSFRSEAGFGPLLYSRTEANDIFDAVARAAFDEFGADSSVRVIKEAQTVKVAFEALDGSGRIVVGRFKKGDEDFLGRNVHTQAVFDFIDPKLTLPGFPDAAKVDFIWVANDLRTDLEKVLVVARNKNKRIWDYEISAEVGAAEVVPLPIKTEPADVTKPMVTPRRGPSEADKEE